MQVIWVQKVLQGKILSKSPLAADSIGTMSFDHSGKCNKPHPEGKKDF